MIAAPTARERRELAKLAARITHWCLRAIDQCRAEYLACKGIESEWKRWQFGWGVFDFALWNVVLLFKDGCKMADGIIDVDDATSAAVKTNAAKAAALLEALQIEWVHATHRDVGYAVATLDKHLDLVHYAQLVRGVSDDLAPHMLDLMRWQK